MLINWVWCKTRLRLNYTFSTSGGRKKNNNRNIVCVFIFNCSRNWEARLQKIMKSLSSSLTSPVVSLVMLPEPQLRRSQGNRNSLSPEQDLGPWRNYSSACLLPAGRCLSLVWSASAKGTALRARSLDGHWTACPWGRPGFIQIRAMEVPTTATSWWTAESLGNRKSNLNLLFTIFTLLAPNTFHAAKIMGLHIILAVAC